MKEFSVQKNRHLLGKRDLLVLEFLARVGYCQEKHLIKFLNLGGKNDKATIYNQILELSKRGFVTKLPFIRGEDYFILLAKRGADFLEVKPSKRLVLNSLNHDMLVLDLFIELLLKQPDLILKHDKEIKKELAINNISITKTNVPDILINNHIAIEVELTAKNENRLREIVNSYILNSEIHEVHYYVKSMSIINRILNLTQHSTKFKGFLFDDDINNAIEISHQNTSSILNNITPEPKVETINKSFNLDDYLNG